MEREGKKALSSEIWEERNADLFGASTQNDVFHKMSSARKYAYGVQYLYSIENKSVWVIIGTYIVR